MLLAIADEEDLGLVLMKMYTKESFLYSSLNKYLRNEDI